MVDLTKDDAIRYGRQMLIPGWGRAGQERLKGSRVFIAGAGGLGSPVAIYLAVAGVGEIHICDADVVELSNLNRQILHPDDRAGRPKAESAALTLREMNPQIDVQSFEVYLDKDNVASIVGQPDVVVDCLDNFESRYLLNRYCLEHQIPFVHGAVHGLMGQVTFLFPPQTPCLRCIFPQAPPKSTFPVVGVTPGVIGCIQALEVLKFLTGVGTTLMGRLLFFDGEAMSFETINLAPVLTCPDCSAIQAQA